MPQRKECGERKRRAPVWGAAMGIAGHALEGDRRLPRLNKGKPETQRARGPTKPDGGRRARDGRRERRRHDKADAACRASTGIVSWQKHDRTRSRLWL
jgi:hypothetical protein